MSNHAKTLLPCPFCGGSARMEFMEGDGAGPHGSRNAAVFCKKCRIGTLFDYPKSARATWNRRAAFEYRLEGHES